MESEKQEITEAEVRKVGEEDCDQGKPGKPEQESNPELEELVSYLRNGDGYFATVTVLKNGQLNHHILTKSFPDLDILKSIQAVKNMSVERLSSL